MILKSCFILVVIQTDEVPYKTTPVMQMKSKLIDFYSNVLAISI